MCRLDFADEPFVPEFPLPNFATAGLGAAIRAISVGGYEDYATWAEEDERERGNTRIEPVDIGLDSLVCE